MGAATRKRRTGQAKFDQMFKKRIKAEHARTDPVRWLAETCRMSEGHVSKFLNHRLPRASSDGHEYLPWTRIKEHLMAEEIKVLEKVPLCS